jgi:ABC-type branched-subunit amino acid transport system substrate-binding protein
MTSISRVTGARRACVFAISLALAAAACSNASSGGQTATTSGGTTAATSANASATQHDAISGVPGVTSTEIRYSAVGTISQNPLGTCVLTCFDDGVKAYFAFRNSQGGVYGRKLVLSKEVDDQLGNNQAKTLQIIAANDTFGTFSAPLLATGWPALGKAGVPTYTLAINPTQGQDNLWGNAPTPCFDCTSRGFAYVLKLAGAKKVAALGYGISENSKLCTKGAIDTVKKYGNDVGGAKIVFSDDSLPFGLPNGIGPEVSSMKAAGVDFILSCLDLNGMKTLAAELRRQGMRDKVKMLHANSYDQTAVKNAGGLFDGDYVNVAFRPFEASAGNSQLKDYHEWMAKEGKPETEHSMMGWINADIAYQGLLGAGPDFDRQKVIDATNRLTAFTAGGLVPPIDWSRQHVPPTEDDLATNGPKYDCVALVTVKDGAFQVVGDATKPWACWSGANRDWAEPTATNFK